MAATGLPHNFLRACILLLLRQGPAYGYDLRTELAALGCELGGASQLYRALRLLEAEGLAVSWWESSDVGPSRRTYHLTDAGRQELTSVITAIAEGSRRVERFLAHASPVVAPLTRTAG